LGSYPHTTLLFVASPLLLQLSPTCWKLFTWIISERMFFHIVNCSICSFVWPVPPCCYGCHLVFFMWNLPQWHCLYEVSKMFSLIYEFTWEAHVICLCKQ
jgi:hypothetical protein